MNDEVHCVKIFMPRESDSPSFCESHSILFLVNINLDFNF